jgi:putative transcriptional regulator
MVSKQRTARAKTPVQKMIDGLTEFAESLEAGEDVKEMFTVRRFALKLQPSAVRPQAVKKARLSLRLSQTLFAQLLGVSASTVQAWEQGKRQPDPMACRVLAGIRRDPGYWKKWFLELAEARLST